LFPEWFAPRKSGRFHHSLVTAPRVVDENVDAGALRDDLAEDRFDLIVVSMITANWRDTPVGRCGVTGRSSRDEHIGAFGCEFDGHSSADTLRPTGDDRDVVL
jgi:hypothetical protein